MYKQFHSAYLFPSVASPETHIFPSLDYGYHICLQVKNASSGKYLYGGYTIGQNMKKSKPEFN